eukprot:CAMPEP_0196995946 /NCGR_PEP_ID=MMETSP1380-20130617/1947_1 /TAXON_ID=5936 /ORGANISM="Euplotes crassus, Strain CT5" /LENGTH=189 /DNA_ID=CAMNT_0042411765 /DNA_START=3096 /DNA_END=3665 /DNA_ORIENTATION=-
MIIKFAKKSSQFRNYFYSDKIVDRVNSWLKANTNPPITSLRGSSGVFKDPKKNNRYSYDMIGDEVSSIKEFNAKRKAELHSMHKKCDEWEDPDPESEDDIFEEELKAGSKVDFQDSITYEWHSGTVVTNLGNIIKVSKDEGDEMEVDGRHRAIEEHWFNKDITELAPYHSKTRSARAGVLTLYCKAYDA